MPRKSPLAQRAAESIVQTLRRKRVVPGQRLPSVSSLAVQADVSYATAWKAVQRLVKDGTLRRVSRKHLAVNRLSALPAEGQTTLAGASLMPQDPQPTARKAWQRIADSITHDLRTGRYGASADLPPAKQLCRLYATSYRTLRKAVDCLVEQRWLFVRGKGFGPVPLRATVSRSRIVVFCSGKRSGLLPRSRITIEILDTVRRECRTAGIESVILPIGEEFATHDRELGGVLNALQREPDVLGYVLLMDRPGAGWDLLFRHVAGFGKPVAVADNSGGWEVPAGVPPRAPIRVCRLADDARAAQQVATHLLRLGHRRIAFISGLYAHPWAQQRRHALERVFASAGFVHAVKPLVVEGTFDLYRRRVEQRSGTQRVEDLMLEETRALGVLFSPLIMARNRNAIVGNLVQADIFGALVPLFDEARADTTITAWVCDNDDHAVFALEYLTEHRIDVPGCISVAGFDDVARASVANLTTYRFDRSRAGSSLVGHILAPYSRARRRVSYVHIDGTMVRRGTTGPASLVPHTP